jgi:hypothetical protein
METFCTWISDDRMCGAVGEVRGNLALCLGHYNTFTVNNQIKTAAQVTKALDCDPSDSVYFLRLPNGNIKIGYSKELYKRMQALTAAFGGRLELIACTSGGIAWEQRLHNLFRDYRITEAQGEQFRPVPEILDYAAGLGLDFAGKRAATRYATYTYTGNAVPRPEYQLAA